MHKKNRQTLVWDNIPEWAIFALEYGIEEELFLPNEDLEMISRFIGENFPNGNHARSSTHVRHSGNRARLTR